MTDLSRFALLLSCLLLVSAIPPDAQEAAMDAELTALESAQPHPAGFQRLRQISIIEERSRRPHPEHPALDLPHFDLAARATRLLQKWQEDLHFEALLEQSPLRSKASQSLPEQRALQRWILQASSAQISRLRQQLEWQDQSEAIQRSFCIKLDQLTDWLALAASAQEAESLRAIGQRSIRLEQSSLLQMLEALSKNQAFTGARAALLRDWQAQHPNHIIKLPTVDRLNKNWLTLALVTRPDNLHSILGRSLYQADSAALAAWGLWRLGDSQALTTLRQYSQSPLAIPHLATEIRTWLD